MSRGRAIWQNGFGRGCRIRMLYDEDIREPLFDYLEERYGKARMIEEKQMGRSRADIVMVLPRELAGIEKISGV